jgi:16S rRNA (adenine1518-N6/adenine1519-N6)-dimethyltransferase
LGQHFLSDPRILDRIAEGLELRGDETVVEIGAGRGSLTERLASRCARLIAIELDRDLAPRLREQFADRRNVDVVEADVLDVSLGALAGGPFVLAGNVPYYITTPILFHALKPPRPARSVFLVQLEVAQRMAASPDDDAYGALSVNLQALARTELLFRVAAGSFTPPPNVESAVVRVTPRADPVVSADEEQPFRRFVQAAFGQRRKQLKTIVRSVARVSAATAAERLVACDIDPAARPETLSAEQFARLWRAIRVID